MARGRGTESPASQHYSLKWNDYSVKLVTAFQNLRDEKDFVDVTIACDNHHYAAHKMVLSACSPYFRSILKVNPCKHPIVILKDVNHTEMERLLEFMYNGEVNIAQEHLSAFLKTAENLKIKGLAGSASEMEQIYKDPSEAKSRTILTKEVSKQIVDSPFTNNGVKNLSVSCNKEEETFRPAIKKRKLDFTGREPEETSSYSLTNSQRKPPYEVTKVESFLKTEPTDEDVFNTSQEQHSLILPETVYNVDGSGTCDTEGMGIEGDDNNSSTRLHMNSSETHGVGLFVHQEQSTSSFCHLDSSLQLPGVGGATITSYDDVGRECLYDAAGDSSGMDTSAAAGGNLNFLTSSSLGPDNINVTDYLTTNYNSGPNAVTITPSPAKEHQCPLCPKSFRTRTTLGRHLRVHRGTGLACSECNKVFYQKSNLRYHMQAKHGLTMEYDHSSGSKGLFGLIQQQQQNSNSSGS